MNKKTGMVELFKMENSIGCVVFTIAMSGTAIYAPQKLHLLLNIRLVSNFWQQVWMFNCMQNEGKMLRKNILGM